MVDEKNSNTETPQEDDDLGNSSGEKEAPDALEDEQKALSGEACSEEDSQVDAVDESEPTQGFTSKHIHPLFKTQAGTDEDSLALPDALDEDENDSESMEIEPDKKRKVAKTMLESDLPDLEKLKDQAEKASREQEAESDSGDSSDSGKPKRKVAKTMLESDLPDLEKLKDKVEKASQEKESDSKSSDSSDCGDPKRKVAKTMLESDLPDLDALKQKIEESAGDTANGADAVDQSEPKEVAGTTSDDNLPDVKELEEKIVQAEKNSTDSESKERLTVARTMLESDFPDLLRIQALIETKESIHEQKNDDTDKRTAILDKPESLKSTESKSTSLKQDPRASYSKLQQALMKGAPDGVRISPRLTDELKKRSLSRSFASISEASTKDKILISETDKITEPESDEVNPSDSGIKEPLDFRPGANEVKETSTLELVESNQDSDDTVLVPGLADNDQLVENEDSVEEKEDSVVSQSEESISEAESSEESVSRSQKYKNAAKREEYVARTMLDHELIMDQLGDSISRIEQKEMQEIREKEREETEKETLDPITKFKTVKSCPWSWEDTGVMDKFRFCGECENLIYDFSGMGNSEAEAMIFQRENRRKFTLYKREDGKFMTSTCPQGGKKARMIAFVSLVVFGILAILVAATAYIATRPKPARTVQQTETKPAQPATADPSTTTGSTTTGTTQPAPSAVPKMNPDGSLYYDAGSSQNTGSVPVQPQSKEEPDYRNVPEADESGNQWKFN